MAWVPTLADRDTLGGATAVAVLLLCYTAIYMRDAVCTNYVRDC